MKKSSKLIRKVRDAQVDGDFRRIGRLINQATGTERGVLLSMLACEVALRKQRYNQALYLLNFARRFFTDEYNFLLIAKRQEIAIKRFRDEPEFAELIIQRRAIAHAAGLL